MSSSAQAPSFTITRSALPSGSSATRSITSVSCRPAMSAGGQFAGLVAEDCAFDEGADDFEGRLVGVGFLASIFHWWSDDGRTVGCPLVFLADRETQRTRRATPPQISAQDRAMRPVGAGIRRPIQAAPLGGLHHTTSQPDLIRDRETTLPDPTQIVLPLRSVLDCVPLVSVSHREHTTTLEIRIAQA